MKPNVYPVIADGEMRVAATADTAIGITASLEICESGTLGGRRYHSKIARPGDLNRAQRQRIAQRMIGLWTQFGAVA